MTPKQIRRFGTLAIAASTVFLTACPFKKNAGADAAADAEAPADTASAEPSASASTAPTATHAWVPPKKGRGGACKHDGDCQKPWSCVSHDKTSTCEKTGDCVAPEVQKTGNTMIADGGTGPSVNWCLAPVEAGAPAMPSGVPIPSASAPPVGPSSLPTGPTAPPSKPCKTNADCPTGKTCQQTPKPGLSVCK